MGFFTDKNGQYNIGYNQPMSFDQMIQKLNGGQTQGTNGKYTFSLPDITQGNVKQALADGEKRQQVENYRKTSDFAPQMDNISQLRQKQMDNQGSNDLLSRFYKEYADMEQKSLSEDQKNFQGLQDRVKQRQQQYYGPNGFQGTYWDMNGADNQGSAQEVSPDSVYAAYIQGADPSGYREQAQQQDNPTIADYTDQGAGFNDTPVYSEQSTAINPQTTSSDTPANITNEIPAQMPSETALDNMQTNWANNTGIDSRGQVQIPIEDDTAAAAQLGVPVEVYRQAKIAAQSNPDGKWNLRNLTAGLYQTKY